MQFDKGPPPTSSIKKQWFPGIFRWSIKIVILPFLLLDNAMERVARLFFSPPFIQVGECKKRGNCCYYVLIPKQKIKIINSLQNFWVTQINGFFFRGQYVLGEKGKKWRVMGCRYLKKNGSCGQHFFRPSICRNWPAIENFSIPRYLKGCGFKALVKDEKYKELLQQDSSTEKLKMFTEDDSK
jgi:Fe-S-cluster containining protein